MSKPEYSKCCLASVRLYSGEEGTNHYICNACDEPCDITYSQTNPDTSTPIDFTCPKCGGEHVAQPDFCTYCGEYLLGATGTQELREVLYRFADYIRHHEKTGLGGPDNQNAIEAEIEALINTRIAAVLDKIQSLSVKNSPKLTEIRFEGMADFERGYDAAKSEAIQALRKEVSEK